MPTTPVPLEAATAVLTMPPPAVMAIPVPVVRSEAGTLTTDATVTVAAPLVGSPLTNPTTTSRAVVESGPRKGNPTLLEAPDAPEGAEPSPKEVNPTAPAVGASTNAPVQRLQAAPDLAVVPQVVANPAPVETKRARDAAPVANLQIAPVAAKAEGPVPEKPSAKAIAVETLVVVAEAATDSGEGEGDAPQNPAPQPETAAPKTAATERPDAGADRPAVDRHLVVRQVADRIESLVASRPRNGVTIHLEPRDLGTVTLVVKGLSNALDVQLSASDDRVRQSLDTARPELAQALAPRGIELREIRVAATPGTAGGATDSNRNPDPNPNPEGRPRTTVPTAPYPKATRAEAPARRSRGGRGVDLLV